MTKAKDRKGFAGALAGPIAAVDADDIDAMLELLRVKPARSRQPRRVPLSPQLENSRRVEWKAPREALAEALHTAPFPARRHPFAASLAKALAWIDADMTRKARNHRAARLGKRARGAVRRRGAGRPPGAFSVGQREKREVVARAVAFWLRFSSRAFSAAPKRETYAFVTAFYVAATGKRGSVRRQFEQEAELVMMIAEEQAALPARSEAVEKRPFRGGFEY